MQVVDGDYILDRRISELIGGSVIQATLDGTAAEPDREALVVMVAARTTLRHGRAAELTGPDDQRIIPQPTRLQVLDERRTRTIDLLGLQLHAVLDAAMMVPVLVIQLNESHSTFRQTPRE